MNPKNVKPTKGPIPEIWYDGSFDLFKDPDGDGMYNLEQVIEHLEKLMPYLVDLKNLKDRVTKYINAGIVNGLQHFLKDPLIYMAEEAGKIQVTFSDTWVDGVEGITYRIVDLQSEVDAMASGESDEDETMEEWAKWFEASAKKIREGMGKN